ncbi:glycerol dehydrogenase [Ramicandelaber brevisporus]|nr:glycerol dehydrogenase [Ramicandelaber brevisporus]
MSSATVPAIPSVTLSNGAKLPAVGFGTWAATVESAKAALDAGYRHFDGAIFYKTEKNVGEAIKLSGVPRSQLFLTGKIWGNHHDDPEVDLAQSLQDFGTDYLDLLLLHWPVKFDDCSFNFVNPRKTDIPAVWKKMEALVDTGKVKAIGVSNCSIKLLEEELLPIARIKPVVNQVESHPYLQQKAMLEFGKKHGIHITAFSPLGGGNVDPNVVEDAAVAEIAKKHGVPATTVLLSWGVQRGTSVIPRSKTPERIVQNLKLVTLDHEDLAAIDGIKTVKRYTDPTPMWGPQTYFIYQE